MQSFAQAATLAVDAFPAVSLYIPISRRTLSEADNLSHLREAIRSAEAQLVTRGLSKAEAGEVMSPANALMNDPGSWRQQAEGLALFVAEGVLHQVTLPFAPAPLAVVGARFHLKPLLPLMSGDGEFFLLTLNAEHVCLYRGSREGLAVESIEGLPRTVEDVRAETDLPEGRHSLPHTRSQSVSSGAQGAQKSQGYESPDEVRKIELVEFMRRVEHVVTAHLDQQGTPLILAADAECLGIYRQVNRYRSLCENALHVNAMAFDRGELHRRAWELASPLFSDPAEEVRGRIESRLGTAEPTVTLKVEEIVAAARFGRVESLLISDATEMWGHVDDETMRITAHSTQHAGDEDLLNYAAVLTLAKGGKVYCLPHERIPHEAYAAALLRY